MKILTITSRIPRPAEPGAGTLVLDRIRGMWAAGAEVRIIHTVARPGGVVDRTSIDGVPIRGVRYLRLPGIGTRFDAFAYARAIRTALADEIASARPDVIDVHDVYPDGVAVLAAAKPSGIPVAVTAHGRDVKVLARLPAVQELLVDALPAAARVIAVTTGLAADLRDQRICRKNVEVIQNGVDARHFGLRSRVEARAELGLAADRRHLVSVGNLSSVSAQKLLLAAMVSEDSPPDFVLHVLGAGRKRRRLERLSRAMGLGERVVFHGFVDREQVAGYLSASDGAVALGRSTGAVQAVREALACRIPVLAADIPVMREIISPFRHGVLAPLDLNGVTRGLGHLLTREWDLPVGEHRDLRQVGEEIVSLFGRFSPRNL